MILTHMIITIYTQNCERSWVKKRMGNVAILLRCLY